MLRVILFSVLLPTITIANQKQPYVYRIPVKPIYAKTGPPHIDKLETHTEPVIQTTQENSSQSAPNEFTAKPTDAPVKEPVNTKPISRNGKIEERQSDVSIPAYIFKSMEINDREFNKHDANMMGLFSNVRLNPVKKIQVPIKSKEPVSLPIVKPNLSSIFVRPEEISQNRLPMLSENANNPINKLSYMPLDGLQLPTATIKPVYIPVDEQTALPEQYNNFKSQLLSLNEEMVNQIPNLTQSPNMKNMHKDRLLKEKLVSLFLSSIKDLQKQAKDLKYIHDILKSESMYKIGYLASHMNMMNKRINKLYKSVENNHHNWDALRILEAYEEVKRNNDTLRYLLDGMKSFLRAKKNSEKQLVPRGEKNPFGSSISWTYYDDTLPST